ncbi:hypothetical protein HanRHA438_Chr05g0242431 [Helianthus annuus]|nr:hypothetical protein HanRHA438_Chr05g0242431 [Helianthus annuus]
MNIRHNTTISNRHIPKKLTQLLIIPHRQLNMSRYNSCLLIIPCSISGQF